MQRVAIGRALVREPALYLMDEPLSSLDAKLRNDLRLELKRIQQDLGATMLYVTHDQIEAHDDGHAHRRARAGPRWCRSARRSRSTRIRSAATSRRASARPRINLLARALVPAVGRARAGRDGRRARRAPAPAPRIGRRRAHRAARVRRIERLGDQHLIHVAARRAASRSWSTQRPAAELRARRTPCSVELLRPLWFDAAGQRIARLRPPGSRHDHTTDLIRRATPDADRPRRGADRARRRPSATATMA